VPVNITLPGAFVPVAATTSSFVVRRPGHYAYQVVAENAAGERSSPSNVQVVPAPEPPATFGALAQALAPPVATIARAGHRSRLQRLLGAAQAAWNRGDRRSAMLDLRRLRAAAGPGDERAMLAERLERALEYSNVAGGP
jgi:hypothetical protein